MKRIIIICSLLISGLVGFSQSDVQRSNGLNRLIDPRLAATKTFNPPSFTDTTAANIAKGTDSCGALIFTYDVNGYWIRKCSPKRWARISDAESQTGGYTINVIDSNSFSVCNGQNVCDTFSTTINFTNIQFINDSLIVACNISSCDTVNVGAKTMLYVFTNALTQTGNVVEFGGNPLTHNTTLNTSYNVLRMTGATVRDYPFQVDQQQYSQLGSGLMSFKGLGDAISITGTIPRAGINYIGKYFAPDTVGYFGGRSGYSFGVNWLGYSWNNILVDNVKSKIGGIFIHDLDTNNVNAVTIYGKPMATDTTTNYQPNDLFDHRIAVFNNDKTIQFNGYNGVSGLVTDTSRYKIAVIDSVDGTLKKGYWVGSGGSGIDSASYHTVTAISDSAFTLNRPNGTQDTIEIHQVAQTVYVDSVWRTAGIDSIYWRKNGITYAVKDSIRDANIQEVSQDASMTSNIAFNTTLKQITIDYGGYYWHFARTDSVLKPPVLDPDAEAYINAVQLTGVTVTTPQQVAINNFVEGAKTDGVWATNYAIYFPVWNSANADLINMKNPGTYNLSWFGTWARSTSGVTPEGVGNNDYALTGITPSSVLSLNSTHLSTYFQTGTLTNTYEASIGVEDGTNALRIMFGSSDALFSECNNAETNTGSSPAANGFFELSRTASTGFTLYRNGSSYASRATTSSGLSSIQLSIGAAKNGVGGYIYGSTRKMSFLSIGTGLDATHAANWNTRVEALHDAFGIGVE